METLRTKQRAHRNLPSRMQSQNHAEILLLPWPSSGGWAKEKIKLKLTTVRHISIINVSCTVAVRNDCCCTQRCCRGNVIVIAQAADASNFSTRICGVWCCLSSHHWLSQKKQTQLKIGSTKGFYQSPIISPINERVSAL